MYVRTPDSLRGGYDWQQLVSAIGAAMSLDLVWVWTDGESFWRLGDAGTDIRATAESGLVPPRSVVDALMNYQHGASNEPLEFTDTDLRMHALIPIDPARWLWCRAPMHFECMEPSDFCLRVRSLQTLLRQTSIIASRDDQLCDTSVLLAAIEQLNRLILTLVQQWSPDSQQLMDLAANSLVILFEVPLAWAMAYSPMTGPVAAWSGPERALADPIVSRWLATTAPLRLAEAGSPLSSGNLANRRVRDYVASSGSSRVWIGLCESDDQLVDGALAALAAPILIALEIAALHALLQKRTLGLLNAMRNAVLVCDTEGRAALLNDSAKSLLQDLGIQLRVGEPITGNSLGASLEQGLTAVLTGKEASYGSLEIFGNKTLRWVASAVLDDQGQVGGVLIVIEDATPEARMRDMTRDWERMQIAGQMAAGLAHEVRSPLAAAVGAIQLIRAGYAPERHDAILDRLSGELNRMNSILTGYLGLASPGDSFELTTVDLAGCMGEIGFLLRSTARLHRAEVEMPEVPAGAVFVHADADSFKQVCLNLARNAFEAMAEGGRLRIAVSVAGTDAVISFADTGPGIPEGLHEQVFRPFFTTKQCGTGLGLPVCRDLVARMGGTLTLTNQEGGGALACVRLQLVTTQP